MRPQYYVLKDRQPVVCEDRMEWAEWMEDGDRRRVALDEVAGRDVSTVFLGLDHSFGVEGPPVLFETMVFKAGTSTDEAMYRYHTWDEAEAGHRKVCAGLRAKQAAPRQ